MSILRALRVESADQRLSVVQRGACVLALSALAACSTRMDMAPVVDRTGAPIGTTAAQTPDNGPPPPGYYRVKPGDTLYRIALENGQNYHDIAAWNNLTNPNQIEVGQLMRVAPPGANVAAATPGVATAPIVGGGVQAQPLNGANAYAAPQPGTAAQPPYYGPNSGMGAAPGATAGAAAGMASGVPGAGADATAPAAQPAFIWPARGPILGTFNEASNKGLNIGGAAGDAVNASADGRVVYSGNGLRGYGNLIIIKHDATFLTAYAHNRALMVKEGDAVTKGQKIAEMGNSDSDRVMLHFEVRRQGKPVDPLKYLPPQ
ncbi:MULTISPECIES: peptidoglycan DD-metalloendopeptidase family protein [Caballeronia]|uniref:peptidoglycan DD-metalloendopeptidase family protein n=1 Tax=Caballeronia TaxID=1827195 RepID=UPI0002388189|nr:MULTISPECIES: peptidoglycan DD-metalloendopeptidase family protein [unclassified Caballeronia]AET89392.1 Peptidase M23 [Burkholderia sp. YI23]BAO86657.1 peptidase M23 [Burkholderia sp. RPE67]BBP96552.1 peptidase [Burkholderia sp. SFA1]MCE4541557.1 peptidoglycan DD-metalloendopeptidase family protein [Caballeronia sp. PC1]MCE4569399.1 peptidoglycan DD-metalloendopeptidase family protein [Caballeronia sp. CLC5]